MKYLNTAQRGAFYLGLYLALRLKAFETGFKFWDENGVELPWDRFEDLSSSGSSGDQTRDTVYYWDSPVDIAYTTGRFNDAFNPGRSGTWYWGVYVNEEQLLNYPGTTSKQAHAACIGLVMA